MLTTYTKERLSRALLSTVVENQPPSVNNQNALEKLKLLKLGELVFEDDDSGSDICDPFDDLKKPGNLEIAFKKTRKRLTRLEQTVELMANFTEEFKRALLETREELQLQSEIYYEDMDQINKTLNEVKQIKNMSKSTEEKLNEIFRDEENLNCGPDLDIPDHQLPLPEDSNPEEYDVLSGVYNMLNTSEDLVVSGPNYDAFRQQAAHWLDRQGAAWTTLDTARIKCQDWMEKVEASERDTDTD